MKLQQLIVGGLVLGLSLDALLANLLFTVQMESAIMATIDTGTDGKRAAAEWLRANPAVLADWLRGVRSFYRRWCSSGSAWCRG